MDQELQNGCLALADANVLTPSTLNDSCIDSDTDKIETDKNMNLATDVHIISRVD